MATGSRYLDRFVRSPRAVRLVQLRLFPNAKEVTETFAIWSAAQRCRRDFPLDDRETHLVAVGDGNTPRTAVTLALNSAWQCHSVDPRLKPIGLWDEVPRLTMHRRRIEECRFRAARVVLVAVHAHVPLSVAMESIDAAELLVIAMPCCVPTGIAAPPLLRYDDAEVLSPQRTVSVWSFRDGRSQ